MSWEWTIACIYKITNNHAYAIKEGFIKMTFVTDRQCQHVLAIKKTDAKNNIVLAFYRETTNWRLATNGFVACNVCSDRENKD